MRGAQPVGGVFALPKGERALAGGDADRGHAPLSPVETWRVDCAPDRSHMGNDRRRGHGPDYRRLTISFWPAPPLPLPSILLLPFPSLSCTFPSSSPPLSTLSFLSSIHFLLFLPTPSPSSSSSLFFFFSFFSFPLSFFSS